MLCSYVFVILKLLTASIMLCVYVYGFELLEVFGISLIVVVIVIVYLILKRAPVLESYDRFNCVIVSILHCFIVWFTFDFLGVFFFLSHPVTYLHKT